MRTIKKGDPLTLSELTEMAERMFGGLVKAVVDVKREIMVVDAELHADEESELLQSGSEQADVWGINLYPEFFGTDDFIEFDSVINIRPVQGNRSRDIGDQRLRDEIARIAGDLVKA